MAAGLARFGKVKVERGEEPEAGKVRLFLLQRTAGEVRTAATIYMDGAPGFTAAWMDAASDKLGSVIWRHLKRDCSLR